MATGRRRPNSLLKDFQEFALKGNVVDLAPYLIFGFDFLVTLVFGFIFFV
jgi:large-conductance mechanosensitive channel